MKKILLIFFITLISIFVIINCSLDRKSSSDAVVEKVHGLIKTEEFDKLYEELNSQAKGSTPRQEFVGKMAEFTNKMKQIDPDLSWNKSNVLLSNEYANLYFVNREIGKEEQKLEIRFTVSFTDFTPGLYDFCLAFSDSNSEDCATNALRKI